MDFIRPDLLHSDALGQQEVEAGLDVGHHGVLGLGFPLDVGHLLMRHGLDHLRKEKAVRQLRLEVLYPVFALGLLQVMVGPVRVDLHNVLLVGLHLGRLHTRGHLHFRSDQFSSFNIF